MSSDLAANIDRSRENHMLGHRRFTSDLLRKNFIYLLVCIKINIPFMFFMINNIIQSIIATKENNSCFKKKKSMFLSVKLLIYKIFFIIFDFL